MRKTIHNFQHILTLGMDGGYEGFTPLEPLGFYYEGSIKITVYPPGYASGVKPQRNVKFKDEN